MAGYFRENNALPMLRDLLLRPSMSKDAQDILRRCATCQDAKSHSLSHGLCTPLSVPSLQWVNVSMEFILGLPMTERNKDSIFIVVDQFSKMTHFTPYNKDNDATHIAELYFKEVMRLHGILMSNVLDYDTKFLSHFQIALWKKMGTKLMYRTTCHHQTDG